MLRLFVILAVFAPLVLASTPSYRLDVKIGDKLTTINNGIVSIYYIQGVEPGDERYVVFCMKSNAQYLMDKKYIQQHIVMLERKMKTIYVSQSTSR
ncbi:MAG: hypothetical protein NTU80_06645 [Verrucomicrobia bacterium]|nr:hypothetical protein [Verrucomicrobiota bacterium]